MPAKRRSSSSTWSNFSRFSQQLQKSAIPQKSFFFCVIVAAIAVVLHSLAANVTENLFFAFPLELNNENNPRN
jgi:hypothetical protein